MHACTALQEFSTGSMEGGQGELTPLLREKKRGEREREREREREAL